MDLWAFTLDNLEAAGVIGGYVAISIIGVGIITFALRNKIAGAVQIGPQWAQPLIGAFLGVIPGCGGTIVISTMYKNSQVSFGALFAAFVTTLGEGSFVLLGASDEADVAGNLTAFAIVNAVGFVLGAIAGYVIDGFGLKSDSRITEIIEEPIENTPNAVVRLFIEFLGFYLILGMTIFLAPGSIMALWGGGIDAISDITVWVAIALTIFSIVYHLVNKFVVGESHCAFNRKSIKLMLMDSIADLTMVIMYVFLGLFICNYIIDVLVGPERFDLWMKSSPLTLIFIAAFIGATPGCGGMIAVAAAFVTIPNFPLAALLAAAVATSGDGIFPLIAQNKKDALLITIAGFVLAVGVGYAALLVGA